MGIRSGTSGGRPARRGFTLFEVSLSLVLVSFGVVSVLLLFPQGIKAEQMSRMRVIAGAKALEIIDSFATSSNANPSTETEAPDPWDVAAGYRVFSADLESRICSHRYGIMPVPLEIARRLDSDNDEIAKVLAEGGQLFYSQASGATGLEEVTQGAVVKQPDALTQRLVFAVTGYAQSNHITYLAQKAWPYYAPYPSPPGHCETQDRYRPADLTSFVYQGCRIALWEGVGSGGPDNGLGTTDGDIAKVFEYGAGTAAYGYKPYALGGSKDEAGAIRYLQSALWYVNRKGIAADWYAPAEPFTVKTKVDERMALFRALPDAEWWKYVQAFRFLSHAATCMTRWKNLSELGGQPSSAMGVTITAATIDTGTSPELMLTHDKIVYYHELCLQMAMLYAASQPYDWGAPRPTQRSICMDHPLLEYDLWSSPLTGTITNTSQAARQWRPIAARPITAVGRSMDFPDRAIAPTTWGDPMNFTLARPFKAEERCRQLVFWAVDWTSYEDFETAPSAPIDASKYQFAAPMGNTNIDDMNQRMGSSTWPDHHIYQFRNPEKVITFTDAGVPGLTTGTDVSGRRILNQDGGGGTDKGGGIDQRRRFLARWGADRNFNGILDRGPLPRSLRLRASEVAHYNFYDPRLTLKLR
jgi:hypothetical protein